MAMKSQLYGDYYTPSFLRWGIASGGLVLRAVEFETVAVGIVDGEVVFAPEFASGRVFDREASLLEPLVKGIGVWRIEFDVGGSVF